MSGYKFTEAAAHIFDASSEKHFIVSPVKKLIKLMLILFAAGVALITLSGGYWCIATIPALLFENKKNKGRDNAPQHIQYIKYIG